MSNTRSLKSGFSLGLLCLSLVASASAQGGLVIDKSLSAAVVDGVPVKGRSARVGRIALTPGPHEVKARLSYAAPVSSGIGSYTRTTYEGPQLTIAFSALVGHEYSLGFRIWDLPKDKFFLWAPVMIDDTTNVQIRPGCGSEDPQDGEMQAATRVFRSNRACFDEAVWALASAASDLTAVGKLAAACEGGFTPACELKACHEGVAARCFDSAVRFRFGLDMQRWNVPWKDEPRAIAYMKLSCDAGFALACETSAPSVK